MAEFQDGGIIMTIKINVLIACLFFTVSFTQTNGQVVNGSFEDEFGVFTVDGWQNNGGVVSYDTPANGGNCSLGLYGGCIWTNCSQPIPQIQVGDIWKLSCWAKAENIWSGGHLSWSDGYAGAFVFDSVWTYYSIVDTFDTPNFDTISIVLEGGGGFAGGGGILVDLVDAELLGGVITLIENDKNYGLTNQIRCYPNPFINTINFTFELICTAYISIKIYNTSGQETGIVENKYCSTGTQTINLYSVSKLQRGIYYYEIIATDNSGKTLFAKVNKLVKL